jgi:hypothetical protein
LLAVGVVVAQRMHQIKVAAEVQVVFVKQQRLWGQALIQSQLALVVMHGPVTLQEDHQHLESRQQVAVQEEPDQADLEGLAEVVVVVVMVDLRLLLVEQVILHLFLLHKATMVVRDRALQLLAVEEAVEVLVVLVVMEQPPGLEVVAVLDVRCPHGLLL